MMEKLNIFMIENLGHVWLVIVFIVVTIGAIIRWGVSFSKWIISVAKQNTQTPLCGLHENRIGSIESSMYEAQDSLKDIKRLLEDVVSTIGRISNDNLGSTIWHKAEPIFRYIENPDLKLIVLYKIRAFIEFVDKASIDIQNEADKSIVLTSLTLGANNVSKFIYDSIGEKYHTIFINKHDKSVERYRRDIELIMDDPINNHKQRFINLSISFMDKFLSEMINSWMLAMSIDPDELANLITRSSNEKDV